MSALNFPDNPADVDNVYVGDNGITYDYVNGKWRGRTAQGTGGGNVDRLTAGTTATLVLLDDGTLKLTHPTEWWSGAYSLEIQKAADNYHTFKSAYGLSLQATPVPNGFGLNTNTNFVDIFHDGISVNVNNNSWAFGTDGSLSLPNTQLGMNSQIYTTSSGYQTVFETFLTDNGRGSGQKLTLDYEYQQVQIQTVAGVEWTFSDEGYLTFPDATVQTTAYTGTVAYSNITGAPAVVAKTTGSWTLATGANTVSITVAPGNNYQMWVNGLCDNGIVEWNATVNVSNTNVPAIGSQYAWYYAVGNALVLTAIPNQIVGTAGVISSATGYTGTTSNVFSFGITNNSVSTQTVYWGYTTL